MAGQEGWVVITKDRRIRYRETERAALIGARVRAFVITKGDLQGIEMARVVVAALPAISRICRRYAPPLIATLAGSGRVTIVYRG